MAAVGIDPAGHASKTLWEVPDPWAFDVVLTVCDDANEACPVYPAETIRLPVSCPDPTGQGSDAWRRVRDAPGDTMRPLVETLGRGETPKSEGLWLGPLGKAPGVGAGRRRQRRVRCCLRASTGPLSVLVHGKSLRALVRSAGGRIRDSPHPLQDEWHACLARRVGQKMPGYGLHERRVVQERSERFGDEPACRLFGRPHLVREFLAAINEREDVAEVAAEQEVAGAPLAEGLELRGDQVWSAHDTGVSVVTQLHGRAVAPRTGGTQRATSRR